MGESGVKNAALQLQDPILFFSSQTFSAQKMGFSSSSLSYVTSERKKKKKESAKKKVIKVLTQTLQICCICLCEYTL